MTAHRSWLHSGTPQSVEDLGRSAIKLCCDRRSVPFKAKKSNAKCAKRGPNLSKIVKFLAEDTNVAKEENKGKGATENSRYTIFILI